MGSFGKFQETQRIDTKLGLINFVGPLALSPDGTFLVCAGLHASSEIQIWRANGPRIITFIRTYKAETLTRIRKGEDLYVKSLAFAPNGQLAVGLSGEVLVCEVIGSGGELSIIEPCSTTERQAINSLAWTSDSVALAAGDDSGLVWTWRWKTPGGLHYQCVKADLAQGDKCREVSFKLNCNLLCMARADGMFYWWHLNDFGLFSTLKYKLAEDGLCSVGVFGDKTACGGNGVINCYREE